MTQTELSKDGAKKNIDNILEQIAAQFFDIDTLKTQNSGEDFHEVAVWEIKQALEEAYKLGR
jgi:hypothetical protein